MSYANREFYFSFPPGRRLRRPEVGQDGRGPWPVGSPDQGGCCAGARVQGREQGAGEGRLSRVRALGVPPLVPAPGE